MNVTKGLTLADEVEGGCRAADENGLASFHLLGYSAGAVVAVALTAAHPERVQTLALIELPSTLRDSQRRCARCGRA